MVVSGWMTSRWWGALGLSGGLQEEKRGSWDENGGTWVFSVQASGWWWMKIEPVQMIFAQGSSWWWKKRELVQVILCRPLISDGRRESYVLLFFSFIQPISWPFKWREEMGFWEVTWQWERKERDQREGRLRERREALFLQQRFFVFLWSNREKERIRR